MDFQPGFWDVSNEEYHATTDLISHSMLECFRKSVPLFRDRFIHKRQADKPTEAMLLGSALHCAVLEPDRFADEFVMAPIADRRTTVGKEIYAKFVERSANKTVISHDDMADIKRMCKALNSNLLCCGMLDAYKQHEQSYRWVCPETGLGLRARTDILLSRDASNSPTIGDIKTTRSLNPYALRQTILGYGYHRQAAHYLSGLKILLNESLSDLRFLFLFVTKDDPAEACVVRLDDDLLRLGDAQNKKDLRDLATRLEFGNWQSRYHDDVVTIYLTPTSWADTDLDI